MLLSGLAFLLWNAQLNSLYQSRYTILVCFQCLVICHQSFARLPHGRRPHPQGRSARPGHTALIGDDPDPAFRIHHRSGPDRLGDHFISSELALQSADRADHLCAGYLAVGWSENTSCSRPLRQRAPVEPNLKFRWLRFSGFILLTVIMLGAFSSTLMTNNGLDAPGVALSVEPMVNVPSQYRHTHNGTFILTTVISHAPILVGEWMLAQVDPAIKIVAPEAVVPKNTTVQEQARQDYQMLDDSEATAITVGLRLAGYQTEMIGKGVRVDEHLAGEPCEWYFAGWGCDHSLEWRAGSNHTGFDRQWSARNREKAPSNWKWNGIKPAWN